VSSVNSKGAKFYMWCDWT